MKRPIKQPKPSSELLTAIKALSPVLKEGGSASETHIVLHNGFAIASNGVMAIGEKVEHDLMACPNAALFAAALSKCSDSLSITQLEHKLSITSGKFRALVPCLPFENLPRVLPDASCSPLDDRLKASLIEASTVGSDEETALTASLLMGNGSVIASDTKVILESWHGCSTPVLVLPKSFAKLCKNRTFHSFGFSNNSFTVYSENGSWVKTQLWDYQWPDVKSILDVPCNPLSIPEDLWIALNAIEDFADEGWAYSREGKLWSHKANELGASYDCYGMPPDVIFSIAQLQAMKSWAKKIDFFATAPNGMKCIKVFGDSTRAVIAGRRE